MPGSVMGSTLMATRFLRSIHLVLFYVLFYLASSTIAGYGDPHLWPRGPISHSIHQPQLTHHDLNNQQWSQNVTIMRRAGRYLVHHNFTSYDHSQAASYSRWTKREVMDEHTFQRRVFTFDFVGHPKWLWSRLQMPGLNHPGCPVIIGYCYVDNASAVRIATIFDVARARWSNALGPKAGVILLQLNPRICPPNTDPRILRIHYEPGVALTTPGRHAAPGQLVSLRTMAFDPAAWPADTTPYNVMKHEIGHVFGLLHEHSRPDARDHIVYNCAGIVGHKNLAFYIDGNPSQSKWTRGPREGLPITVNDLENYGELSSMNPWRKLWKGESYLPKGASINPPGMDPNLAWSAAFQASWSMYRRFGDFDRNSVMMYRGLSLKGVDDIYIMLWNDFSRIPVGSGLPSAGDIAAINAMYPPVL